MKRSASIRWVLIGFGAVVIWFVGLGLANRIPLSAARPPETVKTVQEFEAWKADKVSGKGVYENAGTSYTVMLGPAGRYYASGPSAYLFDKDGRFVDWTPDMGDIYTVSNRFDLTSGRVKDITSVNR